MSDQPPNETDATDEEGVTVGWKTPRTPGAWRAPEKPEAQQGWRVPVLPTNVKSEGDETGEWHLPSPEDTMFSPEDEIEITQTFEPDDTVMEVAEIVPQDGGQRDVEVPPEAVPVAPEDLMFMLEHIEEEDEADSVQMSELVALASLLDQEARQAPGEEADEYITPEEGEEAGAPTYDAEQLSPTERLIINATQAPSAITTSEDDPAAYARRQLEQLSGGTIGAAQQVEDTDQISDTEALLAEQEAEGPADYARRQLEQLGAGEIGVLPPLAEPVEEPVDPRQVELGRQFRETEERVQALRRQVAAGQMSQEDFIQQLRDSMVLDDEGVWWMMGVETDNWYRAENNTWVEAEPPPLLALREYETQGGAAYTRAVEDSLPYLDEAPTLVTDVTDERTAPGIRLDENYMPLPDQVPIDDPDATIAGPSALDRNLAYGQETVPSASHFDVTQAVEPIDYGSTIRSPVTPQDFTIAPDYRLDAETDIYEEAVERRRRSTQQIIFMVISAIIGLTFLAGAAFVFLAISWYESIVDDWELQIQALANNEVAPLQTVELLDQSGAVIASIAPQGDDRRPLRSLDQVSPFAIHAFLTLEDRTFFENPGWSFTSTLRAFAQNVFTGDITSGGSTITQQVARNLVLSNLEPTADRKINEIIVAGELTQRFTKNEILLMYLNNVAFFGNQAYGIEAASQFYFDKPASELTLEEAALLASIPASPANNEPLNNRQTANTLTRQALDSMVAVGCLQVRQDGTPLCVNEDSVDPIALAQVLVRQFEPRGGGGLGDYPHFVQIVLNQLSAEYGDEIFRGGYVVTTTLDSNLQDEAERTLREQVRDLSRNGVNSGAVMVTDPRTGGILAMVGSPDFDDENINGQFNFALGYNQPGSTVKPIVYTTTLVGVDKNGNGTLEAGEEYYTPATVLWDVPTSYQLANGTLYTPVNIDGGYRGNVAMRFALQNSYNIPAVEAYQFVGADAYRQMAEAMGVRFLEDANFGPAAALGATEMRLVDLMEVYGTLANNGQLVGLHTINSIRDSAGNTVPIPAPPETRQVIDPSIAYLMQHIMSDDSARAAAFGRNSSLTLEEFSNQPFVAAKSGTTDGRRDLWTMGFTRNYVVGVWLGTFDDSQTFGDLTGATAAGPVWNEILRTALNGQRPPAFNPPQNGTVFQAQICPLTGAVNSACTVQLRNEIFAVGHPPPDASAGQGLVTDVLVDSWTGLLANENCPGNQVQAEFTTISNPAAIEWINGTAEGRAYARAVGLSVPVQRPPTQACDLNTPIPTVVISAPVPGEVIEGTEYVIRGQVIANNLARYEFQIAPAGTENFQPLPGVPTQTQQVVDPNAPLATWDTRLVPNGSYVLRLAVFATDGGFLYRDVPVTINNPPPTPTPTPTLAPTVIPTLAPVDTPIPFDTLPAQGVPNQGNFGPTPTLDTSDPLG